MKYLLDYQAFYIHLFILRGKKKGFYKYCLTGTAEGIKEINEARRMEMRKRSFKVSVLVYLLLLVHSVFSGASELKDQPEALQHFVQDQNLQHAGIGFYAIDLSSGQIIGAYREQQAIVPASTMKIITSAAALELLGSDYTFETQVFYDGRLKKNGMLEGNLYIEGKGDPTLGSEGTSKPPKAFLEEWKEAIRKAGIKKISGNVVVLDGFFGYEGLPGKWLWEDFGTDYAPGTYGISVFDNIYTLSIRSGKAGTKPQILGTDPVISYLNLDNNLTTSEGTKTDAYVRGAPLIYDRSVQGTVPANQERVTIKSDIPDPGLFLGQYFTTYLRENGIPVKGVGTTIRYYQNPVGSRTEVTATSSIRLDEIVQVLMHRSDNHYAEHLFQVIPIETNTNVADFWKKKGFNTSGMNMKDGSGLSPQDTLSAKLLVDILSYMETSDQVSGYRLLFPKTGQEGTVKNFLKDTPLDGKGYVKTGSMSGVQSYAGYIVMDDKKYAFALLVNHWNGERADLRKKIEKLLVDLFASNEKAILEPSKK